MDQIKESFFLNRKSKEIYSLIIWSRKNIKTLNVQEVEQIILNNSPTVLFNYERDNLTMIPEVEVVSLWESNLKNHIAESYCSSPQDFEHGYCYVAELWKGKYGKKILTLHYLH
ncbi:MAG: hypothetical protein ACFCAD_00605 [Pleurocapsa sp.]